MQHGRGRPGEGLDSEGKARFSRTTARTLAARYGLAAGCRFCSVSETLGARAQEKSWSGLLAKKPPMISVWISAVPPNPQDS